MNFRREYTKKRKTKDKKNHSKEKVSVKGQNVAVTGRIPGMTRAQAENFIHRHGGHYHANISNRTTLLVNGNTKDRSTTKLAEALTRKLRIITPNQIAELNK